MTKCNPMFKYTEFEHKRESLVSELRKIAIDGISEKPLNNIRALLDGQKSCIEFLKYLTPYYVEVLANGFRNMSEQYLSQKVSEELSYLVLGEPEDNEYVRLKDWVSSKILELSSHLGYQEVFDMLNGVIEVYNKYNESAPEQFIDPTNGEEHNVKVFCESLKRRQRLPGGDKLMMRFVFDEGEVCGVSVNNGCFVSLIYGYFVSEAFLYPGHFMFGPQFTFWTEYEEDEYPNIIKPTEYFSFDIKTDSRSMPSWLFLFPCSINLFSVNVHATFSFSSYPGFRGDVAREVTVTPDTLRTKFKDYKFAPYATYRRPIEASTVLDAKRGVVFGFDKDYICDNGLSRMADSCPSYDGAEDVLSYGENFIFIFTRASILVLKPTDHSVQTVSLLTDIEETIPSRLEVCMEDGSVEAVWEAFFGLSLEGDVPLYSIRASSTHCTEEESVCDIVNQLCEYLGSELYEPSQNLNTTLFY